MTQTQTHLNIRHDLLGKVFYVKVKGGSAELHYNRFGDKLIDFYSTGVPSSSRNLGIASQLVMEGLAFAEEQHLKVMASCPFVAKFMQKNKDYSHLLA